MSTDVGLEQLTSQLPVWAGRKPDYLPESDGEPLETRWHLWSMMLLIDNLNYCWRDRDDFFASGNNFVYYSEQQANLVVEDLEKGKNRAYRGPDFFVVIGVDRYKPREFWSIWDEEGKLPDFILELLSPKTKKTDRTTKKDIYEQFFKTAEYFLYDPKTEKLEGWRLNDDDVYEAVVPNEDGWLWSEVLQLWVGTWTGRYHNVHGTYLRFYDADGNLQPIGVEHQRQLAEKQKQRTRMAKQRAEQEKQKAEQEKQKAEQEKQKAEQEKQRADQEKQRADAAEAELARLRFQLAKSEKKKKK